MDLRVTLRDDPAAVLELAGDFLLAQPIRHNLILSLLHDRLSQPEPGRYWIGELSGRIAGLVFQSPLQVAALITPMQPNLAAAMADAIADTGVTLPGVNGEAAGAASFSGQWTERSKSSAIPFEGTRLYQLEALLDIAPADGNLRRAAAEDRDVLVEWVRAYQVEVRDEVYDHRHVVDRWVRDGRLWLWDNGKAVSMAVSRKQVAGVARIGGVFTPSEYRRRGCAAACVHALSKSICDAGGRCILYTDLSNATSNSIYRRMGYVAVAEGIRYRFGGCGA